MEYIHVLCKATGVFVLCVSAASGIDYHDWLMRGFHGLICSCLGLWLLLVGSLREKALIKTRNYLLCDCSKRCSNINIFWISQRYL